MTSTPTFEFSANEPVLNFDCQIDDGLHFECASPYTTSALSNGPHTFTVRATDQAGNVDQIGATRSFTVDAPVVLPPPVVTPPASPPVTSSNLVIFGSLVLISGRSVKLVKGRLVPVRLTCSGPRKCSGRLTVTSDKPLRKSSKRRKKRKRLERLGSMRFSIDGNHTTKVMVPLSRSKIRLLKRLRQIKARATIREVDPRGNPRISTRTFILRAR
jgi:hypothetical protein